MHRVNKKRPFSFNILLIFINDLRYFYAATDASIGIGIDIDIDTAATTQQRWQGGAQLGWLLLLQPLLLLTCSGSSTPGQEPVGSSNLLELFIDSSVLLPSCSSCSCFLLIATVAVAGGGRRIGRCAGPGHDSNGRYNHRSSNTFDACKPIVDIASAIAATVAVVADVAVAAATVAIAPVWLYVMDAIASIGFDGQRGGQLFASCHLGCQSNHGCCHFCRCCCCRCRCC